MATIYVVKTGHRPGIYYDLAAYEAQLNGYPGAEGRKFKNEDDARRYLNGETIDKKGIYAVKCGRQPGIYHSLAECDAQVRGFEGAECKRFSTLEAAERYMNKGRKQKIKPKPPDQTNQPRPAINAKNTAVASRSENYQENSEQKKNPDGEKKLRFLRRLKRHPGASSPLKNEKDAGYGDDGEVINRYRPAPHVGNKSKDTIVIYTDGGCLVREDSAGGWAAVICLPNGNRKEISGGVDASSSERMELLAAVSALRTIKSVATEGQNIELYSDSRYLVDGARKKIWRAMEKKSSIDEKNEKANNFPNTDLWLELKELSQKYRVNWCWIKGHSGNPLNERCDFLATTAAKRSAAEKQHIHDYAGQLEDAKRQIKDLEHERRRLVHSKEKFQFLARRKTPVEDKNLYRAVHDGSIIGFLKWKLQNWLDKSN